MARLTRRGFVKASASGALAAAPALTALSLQAQGQAPAANLRVEKDVVFGKGGNTNLTLDVYPTPDGVRSKPAGRNCSATTSMITLSPAAKTPTAKSREENMKPDLRP